MKRCRCVLPPRRSGRCRGRHRRSCCCRWRPGSRCRCHPKDTGIAADPEPVVAVAAETGDVGADAEQRVIPALAEEIACFPSRRGSRCRRRRTKMIVAVRAHPVVAGAAEQIAVCSAGNEQAVIAAPAIQRTGVSARLNLIVPVAADKCITVAAACTVSFPVPPSSHVEFAVAPTKSSPSPPSNTFRY